MNFNTHVSIFLISFTFIVNIACATSNSSGSDSSVSYLLSCGVSNPANDSDGRNWIPDAKFLTPPSNSISAAAKTRDPALPSPVPYMNARIFKAPSTYKFQISSTQRHWIRLHFYPSTFNNLNSSGAYFSVKAQNFTLLNNFNAHTTALALKQAYIVREFSIIPIQSGSLDLTFTPSANESFAFINGIEIISMPEIFNSTPVIGMKAHFSLDAENYTLQTIVRLNVGGQFIPPSKDSGLSRTWYDDSPYFSGAGIGVASQAPNNVTISYPTTLPRYIAPTDVYKTARTMGPNPNINKNLNISWRFRVDSNFTYVVRLHFCDFQLSMVNQRVFAIFLNNHTADHSADVIHWSGGQGVPTYKDFATYVRGRNGDEELVVKLRPNVEMRPQFYNAILNGIEIFKMNDRNGSLASRRPNPPVPSLKPPPLGETKPPRPSPPVPSLKPHPPLGETKPPRGGDSSSRRREPKPFLIDLFEKISSWIMPCFFVLD